MTRTPGLGRRREATVAAIIGCLTPAFPVIDDPTRTVVLADVTRFVSSQILALPDFLRLPYTLALSGFEWLPMLRWGHPFSTLDGERRTTYVAFWSEAKLGALRNFMKLIRGCALLAYYDHPALVSALGAETGSSSTVGAAVGDARE